MTKMLPSSLYCSGVGCLKEAQTILVIIWVSAVSKGHRCKEQSPKTPEPTFTG